MIQRQFLLHSTDQIEQTKFSHHGRVEFIPQGQLLKTVAVGPFNEELVAALSELTHVVFPKMALHGKWGKLVIFRESALGSPDVLAAFTALLKDMFSLGMAPIVTAFVLPSEVEGAELMVPAYTHCYQVAGLRFATFTTSDEAVWWINSCLSEDPGLPATGSAPPDAR